MAILTKAVGCLGLGALMFAAFGCGEQPGESHASMQDLTPQQRTQRMVDEIQKNPNMTQSQKDAAVGMFQAHMGAPSAPGKK